MEPNKITDTQAALDAGQMLGDPEKRVLEVEGLPVFVAPGTMAARYLKEVVEAADARAETPRRQKGTATLTELDSFIQHVNRHKDAESVVFADTGNVRLTAVLNYNEKGQDKPRWGDHRAVYTCPLSEQWKFWTAAAAKKWKQEDFAQLIEERMDDLASPTGSGADKDLPAPNEVLTMARQLTVLSKGEYSRKINQNTGESTLICKNENDTGSTKIPRAFLLQLPVFEAGAPWAVEARIRFELAGVPIFSFYLYRAEEIKREAFEEVRVKVKQQTELLLLAGSPEQ